MDLTEQNKDDILNIISRQIEQEILLQTAKEQCGISNRNDVIMFLSFYDDKYTETIAKDGKKYWQLSKKGQEFIKRGGFLKQVARDKRDKQIFYAVIAALVLVIILFIWSEFRIL
jgi:hypothetical protein